MEKARDLWYNRVLPLAHNIRTGRTAHADPRLVPYDPRWPADAQRLMTRIRTACGARVLRVDHIGSTAVEGMDAKDVIDIQVTVPSLEVADEMAGALENVGYLRLQHITADLPKSDARSTVPEFDHTDEPSLWHKRIHGAADPGRPANIHIRVDGRPGQQFALLFVDWLTANPGVQQEYLAAKRAALQAPNYADAKEPWFLDAYRRAWEWADTTGWRP